MFKFTIKEESGWMFTTTDIRKLYAHLKVRGYHEADFALEIEEGNINFFRGYPLQVTDEFCDLFDNIQGGKWKIGGHLKVGNIFDSDVHNTWVDRFIQELVKSVIFTCSPIIMEELKIGTAKFKLNHAGSALGIWEFVISDSEGKTIFDSSKHKDILSLDQELFMCMIMMNNAVGQPVVLKSNSETKSGFLDSPKN